MALAAVFKGWAVKLVITRGAPLVLELSVSVGLYGMLLRGVHPLEWRQSVSVGLYGLLMRGEHPWRFGSLSALGYIAC